MKKFHRSLIILAAFVWDTKMASCIIEEVVVNGLKASISQLRHRSRHLHLSYPGQNLISYRNYSVGSRSFFSTTPPLVQRSISLRTTLKIDTSYESRFFSDIAQKAVPPMISVREKLWERQERLGASDHQRLQDKFDIFFKAIEEEKMHKAPDQTAISESFTLEEAQKWVDKNCHKTLKKFGLQALGESAEELSNIAKYIVEKQKENSHDFLDYSFLENLDQTIYGWSQAIEELINIDSSKIKNDNDTDEVLIAVQNVEFLRQKLAEVRI